MNTTSPPRKRVTRRSRLVVFLIVGALVLGFGSAAVALTRTDNTRPVPAGTPPADTGTGDGAAEEHDTETPESPNPPSDVSDDEKGAPPGEEPADHDHGSLTLEDVVSYYNADENPDVTVTDNGDGTFKVTIVNRVGPDAVPASREIAEANPIPLQPTPNEWLESQGMESLAE